MLSREALCVNELKGNLAMTGGTNGKMNKVNLGGELK